MLSFLLKTFKKKRVNEDPLKKLFTSEDRMDLFEDILKYLSGKDIINCLLVNKFWHDIISQSNNFGRKVRLAVEENYYGRVRYFHDRDLIVTLKNQRKYTEMSLQVSRKMSPNHLLLIATLTSLKTLIFYQHSFANEVDMINFFGIIEPHIEDIKLESITFIRMKKKPKQEINNINYQFPKLINLSINNSCMLLLTDVFHHVKTLQQLSIETRDSREGNLLNYQLHLIERTTSIMNILIGNVNITILKLSLDQVDFDYIFKKLTALNRIRFKLESLSVNGFRKLDGNSANSDQIRNFCTFLLLKHARTLRVLRLHQCYGNREFLESIIYSLDNLTSLTVGHADLYEKSEKTDDPPIKIPAMKVITGHSIVELSISKGNSECEVIQRTLLKMLPNLKRLYIDRITQTIFRIIVEHNAKLEFIEVGQFEVYDPLDHDLPPDYECLRSLKKMKIKHHYAKNFTDILRSLNYSFSGYEISNFASTYLAAVDEFDK